MKIRVPQKITTTIEELAQELSRDGAAKYVRVEAQPGAKLDDDCFANVAQKMMRSGGGFQFGWAIWEWPNVLLEAEFWAVWVTPEGEWVDVSPRARGERLLFVADDTTRFAGKPIDSVTKPVIDHPLVAEYLALNERIWAKTDAMTQAGATDMAICEAVAPLLDQKQALEQQLDETLGGGTGRNDRCTCGSGKKFKNCCGH